MSDDDFSRKLQHCCRLVLMAGDMKVKMHYIKLARKYDRMDNELFEKEFQKLPSTC